MDSLGSQFARQGFNSRLREEATSPRAFDKWIYEGFNSRLREEATCYPNSGLL